MYLGKMRQAARVLVGGAQQDSFILTSRHLPHHLFMLGVEHRAPGMLGSFNPMFLPHFKNHTLAQTAQ